MREDRWYLAIIDNKKIVSGKSIVDIIHSILNIESCDYVIVSNIYAQNAFNILKSQDKIIPLNEVLNILNEIDHFEWADFLLFKGLPKYDSGSSDYNEIIAQSICTLRAIDDKYIYIYTRYKSIVDYLLNDYIFEDVKIDKLENLDFPF